MLAHWLNYSLRLLHFLIIFLLLQISVSFSLRWVEFILRPKWESVRPSSVSEARIPPVRVVVFPAKPQYVLCPFRRVIAPISVLPVVDFPFADPRAGIGGRAMMMEKSIWVPLIRLSSVEANNGTHRWAEGGNNSLSLSLSQHTQNERSNIRSWKVQKRLFDVLDWSLLSCDCNSEIAPKFLLQKRSEYKQKF